VHRTHPYNGGSEYNVKIISESMVKNGYDVTVLTECGSDYNGVKVTFDKNELFSNKYDWIIIHGNDMPIQDFALLNILKIKAKTLYWMIKPSFGETAKLGFNHATLIGWETTFDLKHILNTYGYKIFNKCRYIRYAVDLNNCFGKKETKKNSIRQIISCGGFAEHKGFNEIIEAFQELKLKNCKLILTGYIGTPPPCSENVDVKLIESRQDYLDILSNSDLYVMNGYNEGFGLVLYDAMINKIPWISRNIVPAAYDMAQFGKLYSSKEELKILLQFYFPKNNIVEQGYEYILKSGCVEHMTKDFTSILF
jgi:glycosyltransferase involved in cell wall biosynthesis